MSLNNLLFFYPSREFYLSISREFCLTVTKASIQKQCKRVAKKAQKPVKRPRFKIRFLFGIMGMAHKMINKSLIKKGEPQSTDYAYWKANGWLGNGRPWKR